MTVDWSVLLSAAVVAALVSGSASIVVALVTRRKDIDVAKINQAIEAGKIQLSSELAQKAAAENARRAYEFEARKRLYAECEPLLFQSLDLIRRARRRVESLARSAGSGDLQVDGEGWLAHEGYYFQSTVYFLLAPLTSYRILQRRITAIDLRLEPGLQIQYEILRLIFETFQSDFDLADVDHSQYKPDRADVGEPDWEALRRDQPAIYGRQGFYAGTLDTAVERLITTSEPARCKSFGEFCSDLDGTDAATAEFKSTVTEVFGGFHPRRKPILWRVLLTEVALYDAFIELQRSTGNHEFRLGEATRAFPSAENARLFDWLKSPPGEVDPEVRKPMEIAVLYLASKTGDLAERTGLR